MKTLETPILIMDRGKVLQNYESMSDAFREFEIAYAIKSNPHPDIIRILRAQDGSFETASWAEIEYLLNEGVRAEKIVFSNPVKPVRDIEKALEAGVVRMSFDSRNEVEKIKAVIEKAPLLKKPRLLLRLKVDNPGSLWPLTGKFGAPDFEIPKIFDMIKNSQLDLSGFTFHVGSQAESLHGWTEAMKKTLEFWKLALSLGLRPDTLNIGGGFPIDLGRPIPNVKEIANTIFQELQEWRNEGISPTNLIAEPGRYISGSSGTLLTEVIGVVEREEGKWVFLDCGVFTGMMETIDGIVYPVLSTAKGEPEKVTLCGPSCDSLDKMFTLEMPVPQVGDRIYFQGAGAYTTVYASSFNGLPAPKIVFMDSSEIDQFTQTTKQ